MWGQGHHTGLLSSLRGFMQRPSTMDPGSCLLWEALSAAASTVASRGALSYGGHPTLLLASQRDSLTDPWHLWVEGPAQLLEIPSLKPARICSSWSHGRSRAGLAPCLQCEGPFTRGLQVPLEQKSPSLHCSVASLLQNSP